MLGRLVGRRLVHVVVAAMAVTAGAVAAVSPATPAVAATSGNLIVNGNAEGSTSGWTTAAGSPTTTTYGSSGFPSSSDPGSPTRGSRFFYGGTSADSILQQTIDLAAYATQIQAGQASYDLSGWLGGWQGDNDRAALTMIFQNAGGTTVGSAQIGPVTYNDRSSTTKFLSRATSGTIPSTATRVVAKLEMIRSYGTANDGYADDLAFTVTTASPRSGNLILDPGGEDATCTRSGFDGMTEPGWTNTGGEPNVVCYDNTRSYPHADTYGPVDRGAGFFSGGATGSSGLRQTTNVASAASAIDAGGVTYDLSGWLGGWQADNDRASVTATFLDGSGATLGQGSIGPVTDADRNDQTGFLSRSTTGPVPAGTRSIRVDLAFTHSYGDVNDAYADNLSLTLSTPVTAPQLTVQPSSTPPFDHVFFIFMENENYQDIIDSSTTPYINNTLRPMGTTFTSSYGLTHPSDPNYLAASGGSVFGWSSNPTVGSDKIDARHIGDNLDAAGKTWKGYAGGMNGNCDTSYHNTSGGGYYLPDDEPFMMYKNVIDNPARCAAHNQPLTQLPVDLGSIATTPAYVWFGANDFDNMEEGTRTDGDNWLRSFLPKIFSSPAWTQQRSLLVLSWDEAYDKAFGPSYPNHIATILIGSQNSVRAGYTSTQRVDHYSMLRTAEEALGLPTLTNNDKYAPPLNDIWTSGQATGTNIAPTASVVASSHYQDDDRYAPINAVDGIVGSWGTGEWASNGETTPMLQLSWPSAHQVNAVEVYDRPNSDDWAHAGVLTFSDGSTVPVDNIPNDGSRTLVTFPARSVTSVRFTVTNGSGYNVGLSELKVFSP